MAVSTEQINIINTEIENTLKAEEIDFENLKQLIHKRERLIATFLDSNEGESIKLFAQKELNFQNQLSNTLETYFQTSKDELSKLLSARKLTAKYK